MKEEDVTPAQEGEVVEPPKKTNRESLNEMYSSMIDGYDPEDDEGSSEKVMNYLNDSKSQRDKLSEALRSDPKLAQILADIVSGKRDAAGALARHYGREFLNAEEGSDEYNSILQAEKERKEEQEAAEASQREYEANLERTMPEVESYCQENGLNAEDFLTEVWEKLVSPILSGLYSREVCSIMHKGVSYDKDINDALEAGQVKGRNENINKLREESGDGLPKIAGSESPAKEKKPQGRSSFIDMAINA